MADSFVKNKIIVNSNTLKLTVTRKKNASEDDWLRSQKKILGDVLVFVQCPNCRREIPYIDMKKSGVCSLCDAEAKKKVEALT